MTRKNLAIEVESYSGYCAEETPRVIYIGKQKIGIEAIIDRWLAPEYRYFKVRGDDGAIYIIRYDVVNEIWDLTMFLKGNLKDFRLSST